MDERIHGISLQDCAEIMGREGALRAQHGEAAAKPLFEQFLGERGLDPNLWAQAWNAWWTRMESDPSGKLHARFATFQQQATQQAHLADIPDASQDAKEGVTLEVYAKCMAKAATGADMQAVVAAEGLSWEQWQKAQTAWNTAMGADHDHHLTTQYGQLYAKYTPGFQQQMEGQTAAIMAAEHAQREAGRPDEPEEEYELEDMIRELDDPTPRTRWTAAHHVANQRDIGDKSDPTLKAAAEKAYTLAHEALDRFDEITVSEAEALAQDLKVFAEEGLLDAERAADSKQAIERALARGREQLATFETAFAPIRDKAVPERVKMQSRIQDFQGFVETLSELVEEWDDIDLPEAPAGASAAGSAAGSTPGSTPGAAIQPAKKEDEGGFLGFLKSLPLIGQLLKMLGL